MTNPLGELIVSSAGMLMVIATVKKMGQEYLVFRSPVVRVKDPLFEPMAKAVDGQCVSVDHTELLEDPGMFMGRSEHYVVTVFDQCPDLPHVCDALPENVFQM